MLSHEKEYIFKVKNLPCGVCGASGPSDAHHITESGRRISHYATIPLCKVCHQDNEDGIHGRRRMWKLKSKTEIKVFAETVEKIYESR